MLGLIGLDCLGGGKSTKGSGEAVDCSVAQGVSRIVTVTNIHHFSVLHTDSVIGRFRKACMFCSLCIQSPVVQKWIEGGEKV